MTRPNEETAARAAVRRLQAAQVREAERVIGVVARYYGYGPAQLRGRGRRSDLAEARQVAMYVVRRSLHWPTSTGNAPFSLERVGAVLGRDHATVAYGVGAVATRRGRDPQFRRLIDEVLELIDRGYEDDETIVSGHETDDGEGTDGREDRGNRGGGVTGDAPADGAGPRHRGVAGQHAAIREGR